MLEKNTGKDVDWMKFPNKWNFTINGIEYQGMRIGDTIKINEKRASRAHHLKSDGTGHIDKQIGKRKQKEQNLIQSGVTCFVRDKVTIPCSGYYNILSVPQENGISIKEERNSTSVTITVNKSCTVIIYKIEPKNVTQHLDLNPRN